jgi:hypothetical protein
VKTLTQRLTELADLARAGTLAAEDVAALGSMVVEIDEKFGYELAMLEQQNIATPNTHCGYVIGGIRNDGLFNKWAKVAGGYGAGGCPGSYLVYQDFGDAHEALACIDPVLYPYYRVFPVVLVAGIEQAKA